MTKTIQIEQISNKYGISYIWKIYKDNNIMVSGIASTWNEAFDEASDEFKKYYLPKREEEVIL